MDFKQIVRSPVFYVLLAVVGVVAFLILKPEQTQTEQKKKEKVLPPPIELTMKEVEIVPQAPTAADFIRAVPRHKQQGMRNVNYEFHWYVNDRLLQDVNGPLLEKRYYKKGDTIFCSVNASRGNLKPFEMESKKITVANAHPVVEYGEINPFDMPGTFKHQLKAVDADGDLLTYTLVSPLDLGISVDPQTGVVDWYVDFPSSVYNATAAPAIDPDAESTGASHRGDSVPNVHRYPGPNIEIIVRVSDGDGGTADAVIRLDLKKRREIEG